MSENKEKANKNPHVLGEQLSKATAGVADKTKKIVTKTKDAANNLLDVNGDGQVDIEDVIVLGLKTPGVGINREAFLRKELIKNYPPEVIDCAIAETPAKAGIDKKEIDQLAKNVIQFERNCVTGISATLGAPGGAAMAATIPADIVQYYGYMLRAAQKLLYLYGFPEINLEEKGQKFDSETMNILILCIGVMYGVAGANKAIKVIAQALANGVEKKLLRAALTKGTVYPVVKRIAQFFTVRMTKEVFAGFFKKAIPVFGGIVGGGITYLSFKPCCEKLKSSLEDTLLSNPDRTETEEGNLVLGEESDSESLTNIEE